MTREEIIKIIYEPLKHNKTEDMWFVSIIYKDALNFVNHNYAFFYNRSDAEKWLSTITKDGRPYYAFCCDKNYWNDTKKLLDN